MMSDCSSWFGEYILAKPEEFLQIIREGLDEVKRKFADEHRSKLMVGEYSL